VHRPEKQKPEPGRFDLENTSPQDQSIVGLSRLDFEDVFPQAQSTAEPYLTRQLKRDTWLKTRLINRSNKGRNEITHQCSTLSNQQSISEAAMGSTASKTELPLGQKHHTTSAGQTFHQPRLVIEDK
jgi:hypothetical protein